MKRHIYRIASLYLFFMAAGSLYGIGEKTIQLRGDSLWQMAYHRAGITEMGLVRSAPVVVLSSSGNSSSVSSLDLALSFDEGNPALFRDSTGHYRVIVSPSLAAVDDHHAQAGSGAALFQGAFPADSKAERAKVSGPLVVEARSRDALFAPNNHIYDFSIEFWLHPFSAENGERILQWSSVLPARNDKTNFISQEILCVSSKNRLHWSFTNFFCAPDGIGSFDIKIESASAIVPKTWSHHLIRFDSITGMIEYLVNGKTESIEYATSTGREGGEVYIPIAGEGGSFIFGNSFSGLLDEFKIHGAHVPNPAVRKYPLQGGRIETKALDLGEGNNGIVKLEAAGGKVSIRDKKINNEFKRNGRFRFSDDAEMQFFIRSSDNLYQWDNFWQSVTPGAELDGTIQGRYVQLAVDFYPSASGEVSPYLEELSITYLPDEPPLPPTQLTAIAMNGAVQLRWKSSPDKKTEGYLVYYGTASDDYFGEGAAPGASPINAGKENTIYIDGLKNGALYYFRVAAYSDSYPAAPLHIGEFSREVRARPLR